MAYKAPKGTKDVLPEESYRWQHLESVVRNVVRKYGLLEARTPCIEHTELFLRGVGGTTDIVQKEMYTFTDKGDRSITLKPEGTAGAVRMFVENGLFSEAQPTKMYYLYCPVFRYERPQAGRLREHHQFGVEVFGAPQPSADAEVIALASEIFETIGVHDLTIKLNSIGCPKCRGRYQTALREYLAGRYDELCPDCKSRFETNPLRILDCKVEHCKEIVREALVILMAMVMFAVVVTGALFITEAGRGITSDAIFFEAVSAVTTTGLSMGDTTSNLSMGGRAVIMVAMFIGRLGALTVVLMIGDKESKKHVRFPTEELVVG